MAVRGLRWWWPHRRRLSTASWIVAVPLVTIVFIVAFPTVETVKVVGQRTIRTPDLTNRFKRFPCQVPQPRAFRVIQLLHSSESTGPTYIPNMVVLHRCDESSGCCERLQTCDVEEMEKLKLQVLIVGDHAKEVEFTVHNHTLCNCKTIA